MAIGQGPRVQLAYVAESTVGTTPGSPSLKAWRTISRNINFKKKTFKSAEIYKDRMPRDLRHGMHSVEGSVTAELARLTQDDWLKSLLAGTWATVSGTIQKLIPGTTMSSYTVERRFLDIAQYQVLTGVVANTAEIRIQPENIIGVTWGLLGMDAADYTGSSLDASEDAAPTNPPFDAFRGVIKEGGSTIGVITGMTVSIANGRQLTGVVGSPVSPTIFEGQCMVSGTISAFFQDAVLATKFFSESTSSAEVEFDELGSSDYMKILLPKIKYTGADIDPPPEGGVQLNMPFESLYDSVTGSNIQFTRSNSV